MSIGIGPSSHMAEAIHYCDCCSKLIPPGELKHGEALKTATGYLCAACARSFTPQGTAPRPLGKATEPHQGASPHRHLASPLRLAAAAAGLVAGILAGTALMMPLARQEQSTSLPPPPPLPAVAGPEMSGSRGEKACRAAPEPGPGATPIDIPTLRQSEADATPPATAASTGAVEPFAAVRAEHELAVAKLRATSLAARGRSKEAFAALHDVAVRHEGTDWYATHGRPQLDEAFARLAKAQLEAARTALLRGQLEAARKALASSDGWPDAQRREALELASEIDRRSAQAEAEAAKIRKWNTFLVDMTRLGARGVHMVESLVAECAGELHELGFTNQLRRIERRIGTAKLVESLAVDSLRSAKGSVRIHWGERVVSGTVVRLDGRVLSLKPITGGVVEIPLDEIAPRDFLEASGLMKGDSDLRLDAAAYFLVRGNIEEAGKLIAELRGTEAEAIREELSMIRGALQSLAAAQTPPDEGEKSEPSPPRAPTDGLVAYWRFDEASGTIATDSSGNGNHGTLKNMDPATSWVEGRFGSALKFDGQDDYVDAGTNPSLKNDSFTVAAWVKLESLTNIGCVSGKYFPGRLNDLSVSPDLRVRVNFEDSGGWKDLVGRTPMAAGVWHHIASVVSPLEAKVYLDGIPDGSLKRTGSLQLNDGRLLIGAQLTPQGQLYWPFKGVIDELRIYRRALSDDEVAAIFLDEGPTATAPAAAGAKVASGPQVSPTPPDPEKLLKGLVGHWTFDGPPGPMVADSSGKGNHGRFTGRAGEQVPGKIGMAMHFNGQTLLDCGASASLDLDTYTVAAWVRPKARTKQYVISKSSEHSTDGWNLLLEADGRIRFELSGFAFGQQPQTEPGTYATDVWVHIVGSYDGATHSAALYVNGALVKASSGVATKAAANQSVRMGEGRWPNRLVGDIDDARIYDRVLSAEEVMLLYTWWDDRIAALAGSAAEREQLIAESSPTAANGYTLGLPVIVNLAARRAPEKVLPRKLALIGGTIASSAQFDTLVRRRLRTAEGYSFSSAGNLARPGAGTIDILKNLSGTLDRERPELVRICFDVADLARNRPVAEIAVDLRSIVEEILQRGAVPVLYTLPIKAPADAKVLNMLAAYNSTVRELACTLQVPCVDAWQILNGPDAAGKGYTASSGAVTTAGYDAVGAAFLELYGVLERWVFGRRSPTGTNMVRNGGFEDLDEAAKFAQQWRPHNWGQAGSRCTIRITTTESHSGKASLTMLGQNGAKPGAYTTLQLAPGRYELTYWACAGARSRVQAQVGGIDTPEHTVGEEWTEVKDTLEISERLSNASLKIWTTSENVRVWIDDVSLVACGVKR